MLLYDHTKLIYLIVSTHSNDVCTAVWVRGKFRQIISNAIKSFILGLNKHSDVYRRCFRSEFKIYIYLKCNKGEWKTYGHVLRNAMVDKWLETNFGTAHVPFSAGRIGRLAPENKMMHVRYTRRSINKWDKLIIKRYHKSGDIKYIITELVNSARECTRNRSHSIIGSLRE